MENPNARKALYASQISIYPQPEIPVLTAHQIAHPAATLPSVWPANKD